MKIKSSEITPKEKYLTRKEFIKSSALIGASAFLAACGVNLDESITELPEKETVNDELGDRANTYQEITNFNNFYEFTTNKEGVAAKAKNFISTPWQLEVGGLVNNPQIFGLSLELLKNSNPVYFEI